jgi:hypothetical protein
MPFADKSRISNTTNSAIDISSTSGQFRVRSVSDKFMPGTKIKEAVTAFTGVETTPPRLKSIDIIVDPDSIDPQSSSPLFGVIPAELRNEIFKEALTGYIKPSDRWDKETHYTRPGYEGKVTIDVALLSTCRLVYLETCQVVRSVNNHDKLTFWFYRGLPGVPVDNRYFCRPQLVEFECDHLIAPTSDGASMITTVQLFMQQYTLEGYEFQSMMDSVRRCLPNLHTLRITVRHGDWWGWEDNNKLGMNPFSHGQVSYAEVCRELDHLRRNPQVCRYEGGSGWGNNIVDLKGLQKFELELETLISKKRQLDEIVEFSRYWAFPMTRRQKETPRYLVRDDEVSWYGWDGPTTFWVDNPDQAQYTQKELERFPHLRFTYQVALLTWRPNA